MEFSPLAAALVATLLTAIVALIGHLIAVSGMKSDSDAKYVTKEQCSTERQLQCAERAALRERLEKMEGGMRDEMKGMKRTLRITLFMSRELVTYADIPEERKAAILNNDGGSQ